MPQQLAASGTQVHAAMCVAVISAAEMPSSPELSSSMSHWRSVQALIRVSRVAKDLLVTTTSVSAASSCAMARAVSTSSMLARKRTWHTVYISAPSIPCGARVRRCGGTCGGARAVRARAVRAMRARCVRGACAVRAMCVRGAWREVGGALGVGGTSLPPSRE